jgi:hypothetical protein
MIPIDDMVFIFQSTHPPEYFGYLRKIGAELIYYDNKGGVFRFKP